MGMGRVWDFRRTFKKFFSRWLGTCWCVSVVRGIYGWGLEGFDRAGIWWLNPCLSRNLNPDLIYWTFHLYSTCWTSTHVFTIVYLLTSCYLLHSKPYRDTDMPTQVTWCWAMQIFNCRRFLADTEQQTDWWTWCTDC